MLIPYRDLTKTIETVSIITSLGCNLKCEYCLINRAKNETYAGKLQEATIQALKDGTFLNNLKKSLEVIEVPTSQIKNFEFWGQEPTLTLEHLTNHLEDWVNSFENWNYVMFSTNGMAYPEKIVDFIKTLDKLMVHPCAVNIQFSYDGELSTNQYRQASSEIIKKNIEYVIHELNSYRFSSVKLTIYLHGVVSLELLKALDTTEKILDYYNTMGKWGCDLEAQVINSAFRLEPIVGINLETPIQASAEDGLLLSLFTRRSMAIPENQFYNHQTALIRRGLLTHQYGMHQIIDRAGANSVEECVDRMLEDSAFADGVMAHASGMPFCGANAYDLHIMYDGTFINCQNHIFDSDERYLQAENDFEMAVKKSWISHKYYVNPLKDSPEEVQKHLMLFSQNKVSVFRFILDQYINTMYWLSAAGQIDSRYANDPKLTLRHAMLLVNYNCCSYNNYIKTGSMFLRWIGFIRLTCNGFSDVVEAEYNRILSQKEDTEKNGIQFLC